MGIGVGLVSIGGNIATDGDTLRVSGRVLSVHRQAPVGAWMGWFTATPPTGWLICDGSAISRTTYADLFAVLSTAYGIGDGTTTFNLPDFRGRFPFGKAASGTGSTLGGTFGAIDHTHAVDVAITTSAVEAQAGLQVVAVSPTVAENVASVDHTHTVDPASATSGTANPPGLSIHIIIRT